MFKNLNNLTYREQPVSLGLDPFECFKRIYAHSENCFFLESLGDEDVYSRFAYIGFDPEICIDSRFRGNDISLLVGFGISTPEQVKDLIQAGADGVIVGSRIARMYEKHLDNPEKSLPEISSFIKEIKKATIGGNL